SEEGDGGATEEDAREQRRARVDVAARAHETEQGGGRDLHDEAESDADHDAQHERLPGERARLAASAGAQRARHRRRRSRPDAPPARCPRPTAAGGGRETGKTSDPPPPPPTPSGLTKCG